MRFILSVLASTIISLPIYGESLVKVVDIYGRVEGAYSDNDVAKTRAIANFKQECELFVREARADLKDGFESADDCDDIQVSKLYVRRDSSGDRDLVELDSLDSFPNSAYYTYKMWGYQAHGEVEIRFLQPPKPSYTQITKRELVARFNQPSRIDDTQSLISATYAQQVAMATYCNSQRERFRRDYKDRLLWFACQPNGVLRNSLDYQVPVGTQKGLQGSLIVEIFTRQDSVANAVVKAEIAGIDKE